MINTTLTSAFQNAADAAAGDRSVVAWHFLAADMTLGYSDNRKAEVGKKLSIAAHDLVRLCSSGMHASKRVTDAMSHDKGPVLCRVIVSGDLDESDRKLAGRNREVVWAKRITKKDLIKMLMTLGATESFADSQSGYRNIHSTHVTWSDLSRTLVTHGGRADRLLITWAERNGCPKGDTEAELREALKPKKPKERARLAWHFLDESKMLGYGDDRVVEVGKPLSIPADDPVKLCKSGMHASTNITEALSYEKGPILCRVEVSGDIDDGSGNPHPPALDFNGSPQKIAGRTRNVIWMRRLPKSVMIEALKAIGKTPKVCYMHNWDDCSFKDLSSALCYQGSQRVTERVLRAWAKKNGCPK